MPKNDNTTDSTDIRTGDNTGVTNDAYTLTSLINAITNENKLVLILSTNGVYLRLDEFSVED
jgi:hypothetical protein